MSRLGRLLRLVAHPREVRLALSGLAVRLEGDSALGGLSAEETQAVVRWATEPVFIEIGTLFGFTARAVASGSSAHVIAVDNFCWNPFGLSPAEHEAFARRVLEGSTVELVNADAQTYLKALDASTAAHAVFFLDGDHRYEAVKAELEILWARGVRTFAGHDFGKASFGVTRAVREVLGEPDEIAGSCWLKRSAVA